MAINSGDVDVVNLLIDHKVSLNRLEGKPSPLQQSIKSKQPAIVRILLNKGVPVDTMSGDVPLLELAVREGQP